MGFKNYLSLCVLSIASLFGNSGCKAFLENATETKFGLGGVSACYDVVHVEKETSPYFGIGMINYISKDFSLGKLEANTKINFNKNLDSKSELNSRMFNAKLGGDIVFGNYFFGTGLDFRVLGIDSSENSLMGKGYYGRLGYRLGNSFLIGIEGSKLKGDLKGDSLSLFLEIRP